MNNLAKWNTAADSYKLAIYFMEQSNGLHRALDLKVAAYRSLAIEKDVFIAGAWGRVDSVARNGIFSVINMRLRGLVYVEGEL